MKKTFVSLVVVLFTFSLAHGQLWKVQRMELTGAIGTTQIFGDIGGFTPGDNVLGFKDIQLSETRFNIGIGANYRIWQDLNARVNLTYGMLSSDDSKGSNVDRAFASTTNLFEVTLMGEYYFIKNSVENSYNFSRKSSLRNRPRRLDGPMFRGTFMARVDMYAFTGIGFASWSVKGNDALVAHGLEDGGATAIIPAGLGAKYVYSPELSLGVEFTGRFTFTDYLDGYTSVYSKHDDVYHFLNFTATYKFDTFRRRSMIGKK
jgi:hypothetical protein